MENLYLNYYLKSDGTIISRFVSDRYSHTTHYTLLYSFIYNEDLKSFQLYEDYILYLHSWKKKQVNKLNKLIKFIIDL